MKKLSLFLIVSFACQIAIGQDMLQADLKIAFVSYKTGTAEVYLMDPDGSNTKQITSSDENNSFPYQIDNRTIGFTRTDSLRNEEKFMIDIITKKEEKIIPDAVVEGSKWEVTSKNGQYVAFVRSTDYSDRELFIYDTILKRETKISNESEQAYQTLSVGFSWSENGRYLVFLSGPDWFNQYIRIYDTVEDEVVTVTERGYMNSGIQWLTDNETLIANLKIRDQTLYEIYSIKITDGKLVQLTEGINLHPNVSPDGEWIVFESQRHGNYGEAYTMRKDGSDQKRLTNNEDYNGRCIWFKL